MTIQRTYYDKLKARVRFDPRMGWWEWTVRDSKGVIMAQGEEHTLKVAHDEATIVTGAIRIWGSTSRGVIIPATDSGRWFTYEHAPVPTPLPSRKELAEKSKKDKAHNDYI